MSGVAAVVVTLVGVAGGAVTWFLGAVVFGAFVGGVAFTAISAYIIDNTV